MLKSSSLCLYSSNLGTFWLKIEQARKCPNLNCISIMMSFLTYITGFFMNFELLPILTDYEIKKRGG
jgi:Mg2+ and Co2+ transporter CorA